MENPKDYAEKSVALFMQGYNCCQAVWIRLRDATYYASRPCATLVETASVIVMERLLREFPAERA